MALPSWSVYESCHLYCIEPRGKHTCAGPSVSPSCALDQCSYWTPPCLALQAVHESNITHRDVKPENLMLSRGPPPGHPAWGQQPRSRQDRREHRDAAFSHVERSSRTGGGAGDGQADDTEGRGTGVGVDGGAEQQQQQQRQQGVHQEQPQHGHHSSAWQRLGEWTRRAAAAMGAGDLGVGMGGSGGEGAADGGGGTAAAEHAAGSRGAGPSWAGAGSTAAGAGAEDDSVVAPVWVRLIDFGSAVDGYSVQHLYGSEGPTSQQLTLEYAPPEALFGR